MWGRFDLLKKSTLFHEGGLVSGVLSRLGAAIHVYDDARDFGDCARRRVDHHGVGMLYEGANFPFHIRFVATQDSLLDCVDVCRPAEANKLIGTPLGTNSDVRSEYETMRRLVDVTHVTTVSYEAGRLS